MLATSTRTMEFFNLHVTAAQKKHLLTGLWIGGDLG